LLVVISMVALLVALLLPALQSARLAAEFVACKSNMRQSLVAIQTYATDFGEYPAYMELPSDPDENTGERRGRGSRVFKKLLKNYGHGEQKNLVCTTEKRTPDTKFAGNLSGGEPAPHYMYNGPHALAKPITRKSGNTGFFTNKEVEGPHFGWHGWWTPPRGARTLGPFYSDGPNTVRWWDGEEMGRIQADELRFADGLSEQRALLTCPALWNTSGSRPKGREPHGTRRVYGVGWGPRWGGRSDVRYRNYGFVDGSVSDLVLR
jgi:prepilin-type processing-associated H-X9-DG protein